MAILTNAPKIAMIADGVQNADAIRANEEILLELFPDQTTGDEYAHVAQVVVQEQAPVDQVSMQTQSPVRRWADMTDEEMVFSVNVSDLKREIAMVSSTNVSGLERENAMKPQFPDFPEHDFLPNKFNL